MTHDLRIIGSLDGITRSISSLREIAEECGQRAAEARSCTCHPSEAPVPCQQKFAYSECARAALPRIPPDILEDLRWMAESPLAIVTMSKATLRRLIAAYDEQVEHG